MKQIAYLVPELSCQHCVDAVNAALSQLPGVERVEVDLNAKQVAVGGNALDDGRLRAALADAGYEAA
jgi:copper chaperone CopZ